MDVRQRPHLTPPRRLRAGRVLACLSVIGLVSCAPGGEPETPRGGDVVRYSRDVMGRDDPGVYSTVSIYEYSNRKDDVTTGKRIRFRAENRFLGQSSRRNGPTSSVTFFPDGADRTVTHGARTQTLPLSGGVSDWGRSVGLTEAQLLGDPQLVPAIPYARHVLIDGPVSEHCGFRVYDLSQFRGEEPSSRQRLTRRGASLIAGRFSTAAFVRYSDNRITDIIGCSDLLPSCSAETSYRGWPSRLVFDQALVCEYDGLKKRLFDFMDSNLIDETSRSPGYLESRWAVSS